MGDSDENEKSDVLVTAELPAETTEEEPAKVTEAIEGNESADDIEGIFLSH